LEKKSIPWKLLHAWLPGRLEDIRAHVDRMMSLLIWGFPHINSNMGFVNMGFKPHITEAVNMGYKLLIWGEPHTNSC